MFVLYCTFWKTYVWMWAASCKILCLFIDAFPPLLQTSVGSHTSGVMRRTLVSVCQVCSVKTHFESGGRTLRAPGLATQFQCGSIGVRPQPGARSPSGIWFCCHDIVHLFKFVGKSLFLGELILFQSYSELFIVFYGIAIKLMQSAIGVKFSCMYLERIK